MKSTTTLPQTPTPCPAPPCTPEVSTAPEQLLTQVQMAERLGISRRTLATWVKNHIVPMIKVRGYCRFDYAKVCAALERHERPAATSPDSTRGINR
jgi:excisionase family DNA binding protein